MADRKTLTNFAVSAEPDVSENRKARRRIRIRKSDPALFIEAAIEFAEEHKEAMTALAK